MKNAAKALRMGDLTVFQAFSFSVSRSIKKVKWFSLSIFFLFILPHFSFGQSNKLEQAQNGGVGLTPISPVSWTNGNANETNSHYEEGQSIPYRLILQNFSPGNHTIVIGWDIRQNGKSAFDYITSYNRISETVDPLQGLSGSFGSPSYSPIPKPGKNVLVTGVNGTQSMPSYSIDQLPANDKRMTIYNATIQSLSYSQQGNPALSTSETRLTISFKVSGSGSKTVVLAWGAHTASRLDWGAGNASSDINGYPYHTRLISSCHGSNGNQDWSCKVPAVVFKPTCSITGNAAACQSSTVNYSASTNAPTPVYTWAVTGGTIASGAGTKSIAVAWGTGTTGNVSVQISDKSCSLISKTTNCSLSVSLSAGPSLAVNNAIVCSGSPSNILLAVSGSMPAASYTINSVTVPTGLTADAANATIGSGKAPNAIANDKFTNTTTSPLTVTYSVSAVGAAGCMGSSSNIILTVNPVPVLSSSDASVCSTENGGNTAIVNLNDYITLNADGTTSFLANGGPVSDPTSYHATTGDVISVTFTNASGCTASTSFSITVNDRQSFGVCAPSTGKNTDVIGSELTSLNQTFGSGQQTNSSEVFLISGDKALIEIIFFDGKQNELMPVLTNLGLTDQIDNGPGSLIITGLFPIANLPQLNNYGTLINYVRPAYPPLGNVGTTTTQGDKALSSDLVRLGYNIGGQGVKVGVLSDSYNTQGKDDVSNGDLPGATNPFGNLSPVQVVKEYPYGTRPDEGRAMLQIIHDIAPKAQLAFRTGFISAGDFAQGIKELQVAGCDIIVDDITYITEPFFKDGKVAQAVDYVTAQGVSYFTAAGNFGNKSYEGVFNPSTAPGGLTGMAHNYGGGDKFQSITVGPGTYTIVLQWEDPIYSNGSIGQPQPGTQNDLDIYLTNNQGATRFGFNRNNVGGDPIEILPFTVQHDTTTDIMIVRAGGTENVNFKYVVVRGDQFVFNEYNNNGKGYSTIVGQSNAQGAMTVGAVLYSNTPAYNFSRPEGSDAFTVASFSSIGGTLTNGEVRNKPDFTAPNGGNTTVNLGGKDYDLPDSPNGDGFPNFYGTSAAAPHAAAVAALVMEARSKYWPASPAFQPSEIRQLLQSTAKNMYDPGFDFKSGAGFIRADKSLLTIAEPSPDITSLIVPDSVTAGTVPFIVTVTGTNLTPESKVLFRSEPVQTSFNEDTKQLQANIPQFEGNPAIQVSNASISPSGLDGGVSPPHFFFGTAKAKVVIKADNKSKKYGEKLPKYTASVLVDVNGSLTPNQLSLEDIGLTNEEVGYTDDKGRQIVPVQFASPATSLSDVRETGYIIIPSHTKTDISFRELFNYDTVNYQSGVLVVEKLPLNITPNNLVAEYGVKLDDKISFFYAIGGSGYDSSNISDTDWPTILNSIKEQHEAQLYDSAIALVDSRQLVNSSRQLVNSDLANLSFLASSRALVNSRQLVNSSRQLVNSSRQLVNGTGLTNVVDFDQQSIFNYRDGVQDTLKNPVINSSRQLVNHSRALVNSRQLVNGEAFVNSSRQLVNSSRQLVNSSGSAALVNSTTVGTGDESSNRDVLVIIDSLDVFSEPIQNSEGDDVWEISQLFSVNMVTGLTAGTQTIVPGAFLSENFDISYGLGSLTILPDTLLVTSENKLITFGQNQPHYTSTFAGFQYDDDTTSVVQSVTYTLKDAHGNPKPSTGIVAAGLYDIVPDATLIEIGVPPSLPSNYIVQYQYGKLTVDKAAVTITADSAKSKIYGNPDPTFTYHVTSGALISGDSFSGVLSRAAGEGVGKYSITKGTLSLDSNYVLSYVAADFKILPRLITIKADAKTKVYGSADPLFTYTMVSGSLVSGDSFSGSLSRTSGANVGTYPITQGTLTLNGNYTLTYLGANLTVTPASLTVKADDITITVGQTPTYTATITGWVNGDIQTAIVKSGPSFSVSGSCLKAGTYTITPSNLILFTPPNYVVGSYLTGTLIVNPIGHEEEIIPKLKCVEALVNDPAKFKYIAHFKYSNTGTVTVSIPVGSSNKVTGVGSFYSVNQPILFVPGGGTFDVKFNGEKITWTVISYENGKKYTLSAYATSSSATCQSSSGARVEEVIPSEEVEQKESVSIQLFPNPTTDRVIITVPEMTAQPSASDLQIMDRIGRSFPVKAKWFAENQQIEIDLSDMTEGPYFIRVRTVSGFKISKVLKVNK